MTNREAEGSGLGVQIACGSFTSEMAQLMHFENTPPPKKKGLDSTLAVINVPTSPSYCPGYYSPIGIGGIPKTSTEEEDIVLCRNTYLRAHPTMIFALLKPQNPIQVYEDIQCS